MISEFTTIAKDNLVGKVIKQVRYMTDAEKEYLNWDKGTMVIVLHDGTIIMSSSDDEMNDAGTMHIFSRGKQLTLPSI
jgi:hypothetical protein